MVENVPSVDELLEKAVTKFREEFQCEPQAAALAPGRVNLIGEHTDYNEGFVLPMALSLVTIIVGSKTPGEECVVVTTSQDVDEPRKVNIDMPNKRPLICVGRPDKPTWANYIKGVIANYMGEKPPFRAVIVSSVPVGSGLSSSAALEVATYLFLDAINAHQVCNVMPTDKALACQKAEHDYAGVPCGIMDQFVSMMGCKDHALLIDCRSMASYQVPLGDPEITVLITNSNVKHTLSGSEYPTRRKQCEEAALLVKKISLRDATKEDIECNVRRAQCFLEQPRNERLHIMNVSDLKMINANEDVIRRARHVVAEIERTKLASQALKEQNYVKFGKLMNDSHQSLREDFEVSCQEIDQLIEIALCTHGVLGSRITGGGFGGCTVTLIYKQYVNNLIENIEQKYNGKASFYICQPSGGARIISI